MSRPDVVAALRGCRMVLCVGDADGTVAALQADGVPALGLDAAVVPVRRLHHFRHRFDGIACNLDALGGELTEELDAALAETLLPGGRLVLRSARHGVRVRKNPAVTGAPPPAVTRVAPYADLFVGCARVLVVGAGSGRFLDALRLRGIVCAGLEPHPGRAAAARARGHDVVEVGLAGLAHLARGADGVFLGPWLEGIDDAAARHTFAACRQVLATGGRLVVRCSRPAAMRLQALLDPGQWQPVRVAAVPGDPRDVALLAIAAGVPTTPPAGLEAVPVDTGSCPLEQAPRSFHDLERAERQVTSQGGEDGVLAELFARLGTTNRHYVEFGCGDGLQCNTTQLRRSGWRGLLMDGKAEPAAADAEIHAAWITAENIEALFDRHGVPTEPDLLSIDVDGNDYWIWRAITRRPRVVVIEYNANLPADRALTIPYDPQHRWDGSDFYGASLLALAQLGAAKGYALVYCTQAGVNAFFVRDDLLPAGTVAVDPRALYRPPNYWYRGYRSRPDLTRAMRTVGPSLAVPVR